MWVLSGLISTKITFVLAVQHFVAIFDVDLRVFSTLLPFLSDLCAIRRRIFVPYYLCHPFYSILPTFLFLFLFLERYPASFVLFLKTKDPSNRIVLG